jgi:hypothetical protein
VIDGKPNIDEAQRQILDQAKTTGSISEGDWKAANDKVVQCAFEKGVVVQAIYEGTRVSFGCDGDCDQGVRLDDPSDIEQQIQHETEVLKECTQYSVAVNSVYDYIYGQGRMEDPETDMRQVFNCMIADGSISQEVSFEEFYADVQREDSAYVTMDSFSKCLNENMG